MQKIDKRLFIGLLFALAIGAGAYYMNHDSQSRVPPTPEMLRRNSDYVKNYNEHLAEKRAQIANYGKADTSKFSGMQMMPGAVTVATPSAQSEVSAVPTPVAASATPTLTVPAVQTAAPPPPAAAVTPLPTPVPPAVGAETISAPPTQTPPVTPRSLPFVEGTSSLYLDVSGGSVLSLQYASSVSDADAQTLDRILKGACLNSGAFDAKCAVQIQIASENLDRLRNCPGANPAGAKMIRADKLGPALYLGCADGATNCWASGSAKFVLSSDVPQAIARVQSLTIGATNCPKIPVDLKVTKARHLSRSSR